MFDCVYFEISGVCNAKCKYCQTGRANIKRLSRGEREQFIDLDEFKKSIEYILANGFINSNTIVSLYSWGEPFLHPKFKEIINYLNNLNLYFCLSTNASKPIYFENSNALKYLKYITFSMSGFSQESYNRIHGFNFVKIKKNIISIIENFRQCGFTGQALISYHIYQFNLTEIQAAMEFAEKYNITFAGYCAYFNGIDMFEKYLKNELEYSELKCASTELLLGSIEKRLTEFNQMDKNYNCPQFNKLTIDEHCNVLICCAYSDTFPNAVYKKIYNINNVNEINTWRKNSKECRKCIDIGMAYVANNVVFYNDVLMESQFNKKFATIENKDLFFWGTGNDAGKYLRLGKNLKISAFVDSNKEKQGSKFNGYDVISPKELFKKQLGSYFVIITSTKYGTEIASELEKKGLVRGKDYNHLLY
jgi:wyosine [tRNA(Phe)-imidazoG37] synthetase (radical SAM superfamily)